MRILQLCTKIPFPPKDGGAAAVLAISMSLTKLGHSVDVLAVNSVKHFVSSDKTKHLPFQIHSVEINTQTTISGAIRSLFSRTPYHASRFTSTAFNTKLKHLLTNHSFDIVQIEGIYLCSYIPVIREHSKAKIILRAHNIEHSLWNEIAAHNTHLFFKQYLALQSKRIQKFENEQLGNVDGIVTITENDEAKIRHLNSKTPLITIPFGVEPLNSVLMKANSNPTLFYIGALDWIPNQEGIVWFLEKVWPNIHYPNLQLHVAGRNAPKWLIAKLKKTINVIFHGEVEQSTEFISQYNIMIVPLNSGSGMRVKIIEAMNMGKLIIATAKACEGIPVTHGKHLWMANSTKEFSEYITHSLNVPETSLSIRKEALQFVNQQYNSLTLSTNLTNFYKQLQS